MLKKSKVVALLAVCVMMFAVVEPACAWSWGEWFSNLFGVGTSNPSQNYVPQGGAYKDIKGTVPGMDGHHLIPKAVSPFSEGNGPAVLITPEDHRQTASYGNSLKAQQYRDQVSEMVKQGNTYGALQMGAEELRQLFGKKYEPGINEALKSGEWDAFKIDMDRAVKLFDTPLFGD